MQAWAAAGSSTAVSSTARQRRNRATNMAVSPSATSGWRECDHVSRPGAGNQARADGRRCGRAAPSMAHGHAGKVIAAAARSMRVSALPKSPMPAPGCANGLHRR
ncbi:hypothetical protein [Lysobacter gummosus]|uniref:hypothetical protein n=1 Tax=Lysobacter gummosus TaxID=262324 RepID=UPI00363352C0